MCKNIFFQVLEVKKDTKSLIISNMPLKSCMFADLFVTWI